MSHAFRRIERFERIGATSHAWIALLRMIEAYARSTGETFSSERAALERRAPLGARPGLPEIVQAARLLVAQHELQMAACKRWVDERRGEKRRGEGERRRSRLAELLARERRVAANPRVRVGCWGWRRRAQEASAAGVSGPLGKGSGLAM